MSTRQSFLSPQLASVENGHIAAGWDTFAVFPLSQVSLMQFCSGTPKEGMSYFFSVGDFGVAACETAYKARIDRGESENDEVWSVWPPNLPSCKAGNVERSGGIGHYACGAENQCLG